MTHDDLAARLRGSDDDPPPAGLLAAARAAYSWRTLDTDLCAPSYDSLLDEALSAVRGEQDARLLTFATEEVSVDLEVSADGRTRALVGQVTPAGPAEVTIRHGGAAETTATTDELGRFAVGGLLPGAFSMRCFVPSAGRAVHTDWVLI